MIFDMCTTKPTCQSQDVHLNNTTHNACTNLSVTIGYLLWALTPFRSFTNKHVTMWQSIRKMSILFNTRLPSEEQNNVCDCSLPSHQHQHHWQCWGGEKKTSKQLLQQLQQCKQLNNNMDIFLLQQWWGQAIQKEKIKVVTPSSILGSVHVKLLTDT